jgi:hypothetical protein
MNYIFMAGAPGSKWSSVAKNIYYSPDIDNTDYSDEWTYYHDASGEMTLMHMGAYFDPGMECNLPESLSELTKYQAELLFNAPFSGDGVRIIKSHIFCYPENIDYLRKHWPDCPIVLVHRSDDACLGWWVKCGHFNITYPNYSEYYVDLKTMATRIKDQNDGLTQALNNYDGKIVTGNRSLCDVLGIARPDATYQQHYSSNDIRVKVI